MSYHLAHAALQAAVGLIAVTLVVAPAWLFRFKPPVAADPWPDGWHYADGLDPQDAE